MLPDYELLVEVSWPVLDGGAAATLQLHLAHPSAVDAGLPDLDGDGAADPCYASCYDAFFLDPKPNWGDPSSAADDPVWSKLVSATGALQQIGVPKPEAGKTYRVGVYRWPAPPEAGVSVARGGWLRAQVPAGARELSAGAGGITKRPEVGLGRRYGAASLTDTASQSSSSICRLSTCSPAPGSRTR